ncbi:MAG: hypothetical protein ACJAUD_000263 [Crocinitomicaceae bacterium]|jgi:hypothetical protein
MANYVEYAKNILKNMSFCPILLNKEYRKCIALLSKKESQHLNDWIKQQKFSRELKNRLIH